MFSTQEVLHNGKLLSLSFCIQGRSLEKTPPWNSFDVPLILSDSEGGDREP